MEDNNLTPTKDLQVDESELSPEEKGHFEFPWTALIVIGVLLIIIAGLIVAINLLGGPIQ